MSNHAWLLFLQNAFDDDSAPQLKIRMADKEIVNHSNAQSEQQRNCPLPLRVVGGRMKEHFVFRSPSNTRRLQHSIGAAFPCEAGEPHSLISLSMTVTTIYSDDQGFSTFDRSTCENSSSGWVPFNGWQK
jgi:hypothetical protein